MTVMWLCEKTRALCESGMLGADVFHKSYTDSLSTCTGLPHLEVVVLLCSQ